ncbi:MAG: hypothetical protein ISR72_05230 [Methylobacter sp.]|nr:hypothetical protein [Methylobacter sp.]
MQWLGNTEVFVGPRKLPVYEYMSNAPLFFAGIAVCKRRDGHVLGIVQTLQNEAESLDLAQYDYLSSAKRMLSQIHEKLS